MQYREISHQLTGQWEDVLSLYGIDVPKMKGKNSKNHPCPCCGGSDRAHWREVDGRLALYCRTCAAESMKSPEDVIMEVCGIDFKELYQNLLDYTGNRTPEQVKQAQIKVKSNPVRNMPTDHKQDHDKSVSFIKSLDTVGRHYIFDRYSVQYPYDIYANKNAVFFDIKNENDVIVNVFAVFDKKGNIETDYLAGGISYGCYHTIAKCQDRNTEGTAYCTSVIRGLHHWWKTGQETRVVFGIYNLIWMLNVNLIDESVDTIVVNDIERKELPLQ